MRKQSKCITSRRLRSLVFDSCSCLPKEGRHMAGDAVDETLKQISRQSASTSRRHQKIQAWAHFFKEVGDLLSALREHEDRAGRRVSFAPPSARIKRSRQSRQSRRISVVRRYLVQVSGPLVPKHSSPEIQATQSPNKTLEPTSTSVMSRAIVSFLEVKLRTEFQIQARATPAVAVAHLCR